MEQSSFILAQLNSGSVVTTYLAAQFCGGSVVAQLHGGLYMQWPFQRIHATKMRCYRKILRILYKDHVINEKVLAKIQQAIGSHEDLLTIVKRCSGMVMSPVHQV